MRNKLLNKILLLSLCFFSLSFYIFSQENNFTKGEDLFTRNEPEKAIPYLKKSISEGNQQAYIYLSLAYYQIGKYSESIDICNAGMKAYGTDKKVLAYNAGNTAYKMGDFSGAESWYNKAIVADPFYSEPVLNMANTLLSEKKYKESKADYIKYLEMEPEDPQYEQIKILIGLLDDQIAADEKAEADKLVEEKRLKDEADRIAAEEAARRKKLLEDVANSLQETSTENVSAGAESTVDYDYESELE